MYKVKIYGAGSIGNHLAQASRAMGWEVHICDLDEAALERTRNKIYPSRYTQWDDSIQLYTVEKAPTGIYDMILIGTPPDSHMKLAISAVEEGAKTILVEKPACTPDLSDAQKFYEMAKEKGLNVFVGYDHVVSKATSIMNQQLDKDDLGNVLTLDVEFREHWGGIFGAHPWLNGPWDSYLGFWKRGGGAAGEHSHAVNLWQHFAHNIGAGKVVEVNASLEYVKDKLVNYDKLAFFNLRCESGLLGRVVQDVVTRPPRKWARIQSDTGYAEWYCGLKPGQDTVEWCWNNENVQSETITKNRPDDFISELTHIRDVIEGRENNSPISIDRGLDTMLVIAAAHLSNREGRRVKINYKKGYSKDALKLV
jgi:predicted dehydrogenase